MLCSTWLGAASSALGKSGKQVLFDTCHPPPQEALHFNHKRLILQPEQGPKWPVPSNTLVQT